jgi:hypothetical protein
MTGKAHLHMLTKHFVTHLDKTHPRDQAQSEPNLV